MIKGAIRQEDTIILNVYGPSNSFKRYEAITKRNVRRNGEIQNILWHYSQHLTLIN